MSFNSIEFLVYFTIVVVIHFSLPTRYRWIWLLIASYYFYACVKPVYGLLLITCTLINYVAGILIARSEQRMARKVYLVFGITGSLVLLIFAKYFNFLNDALRTTFNLGNVPYNMPDFPLLLPLGISFYTLQSLSYTIDVYRKDRPVERHFGIFALYVSFFPLLLSGPIERSTRLLPQFCKATVFDYDRITSGLRLMLWGFFQKVVIADRLAVVVNQVYNNPSDYQGIPLLIATVFFTFQVYCDFAGYSHIAIGAARVMGYEVMSNFAGPYFSKSMPEFWRRWHIALSSWFRDYVYIPLGGNRRGKAKQYLNLFTVFIVSGLWHGANWTYILWGVLHGFYMLCSLWLAKFRLVASDRLRLTRYPVAMKFTSVIFTFTLVSFAWIFFRANTLADAFYIATHLHINVLDFVIRIPELGQGKGLIGGDLGLSKLEFILAAGLLCMLGLVHWMQRRYSLEILILKQPVWIRWPVYYCFIFITLLLAKPGTQEFIYMKF
jgi:alginate O-acetyltransferase complex protein AlgI